MTTQLNKNKILNILIVIFVLLSLFIVGYIFSNSFDSVEQSNEKSENISSKVQQVVDPQKKIPQSEFHKYVRKGAHVTEFCALGFCVGMVFLLIFYKTKKRFLVTPFVFCAGVGAVDEYIQKFTARGSQISDVLIDIAGSVLGLAFVLAFSVLITLFANRRENK